MKTISIAIALLFLASEIQAQSNNKASLQAKIDAAQLVFEGRVIADSSFWNSNQTSIYTIKFVLVSKQFKGAFTSDTLKVITRESGVTADGVTQTIADGGKFVLPKGMEGIFFCKQADPTIYRAVKLSNDVYQTNLRYGCDGFIHITCTSPPIKGIHTAECCDGTFYDDIQNELYPLMEEILDSKYKQIRLNCLEQSKPAK